MARVRSILVRAPNWLGDLVMSTPGLRALRETFPEARIVVQVRSELERVLSGVPWVDEVLPLKSYHRGPLALLREGLAMRARGRFDLGLCLPNSFSSALLLRIAGVRRVVGYRGGLRDRLLHDVVNVPEAWGSRWVVARERFVLGLCAALGCREDDTRTVLFTTIEDEQRADRALLEAGVDGARPVVTLAPGASYGPAKRWPPDRFAAVGDAAVRAGAQVVVLGAASEVALARQVAAEMKEPCAQLAGALDPGSLKAVLRRSRVLVCNDAGARHVAVAFGVPCIALFGPTRIEKTNLNLSRVTVLAGRAACRPCTLRVCPIDQRCMTRIEIERVVDAVREILAAPAASSA